jgi:dihydrofolate reductase
VRHDLESALAVARHAGESEAFVIGGAELYRAAMAFADRLYLTMVQANVEGDVRFPEVDAKLWREVSREDHPADERNAHPFAFTVLARV